MVQVKKWELKAIFCAFTSAFRTEKEQKEQANPATVLSSFKTVGPPLPGYSPVY